MYINIRRFILEAPFFLKIFVVLGLSAPLLVFIGLLEASENKALYSVTPVSVFITFLCGVVSFFASTGIIYKNPNARWFYLLGWGLIGLIPFVLVSSTDMYVLLVRQLIFHLLMGVGIIFYFFKSKEVVKYFSNE